MKHLVITPFYPYAKPPLTDAVLFGGSDVLDVGLENLKHFLLASLENQSCKDFILLLGINKNLDKLRPDIYEKLVDLSKKYSFKIEIMDWFSYYNYANSLNDIEIISTRIDHDDCLFYNAVRHIQDRAEWKTDLEFFAFMSGAALWTDTYTIREYVSDKWRDGLSSFSASPTFYCKWDKVHALPVHGHARVTSITNKIGVELIPGVNHFYDYDTKLAWLYVRNGYNRSREVWYKFGNKLDLTQEQVKHQFGIDIPINQADRSAQ